MSLPRHFFVKKAFAPSFFSSKKSLPLQFFRQKSDCPSVVLPSLYSNNFCPLPYLDTSLSRYCHLVTYDEVAKDDSIVQSYRRTQMTKKLCWNFVFFNSHLILQAKNSAGDWLEIGTLCLFLESTHRLM